MEARLPTNKLCRIKALVLDFSGRSKCTKRELLSLLGHLNFATRVLPPGRSFVARLLEAAKRVKELHHFVSINAACRADLHMWEYLLEHWNGVSLFIDEVPTAADDINLFTDASGTLGFGGFYQGQWFHGTWPQDLLKSLGDELSIAFQELYPIVIAAILWGSLWSRKKILFFCNNLAVVYILNKGRSPCKQIMNLVRKLTLVAMLNNFSFTATHLSSKSNCIADALSRQQIAKFRQLAPSAEPQPCQLPSEIMFS